MKTTEQDKKGTIWVLIYTKAKQEIKAKENLQNQGFKTFLPLINATNRDSEFRSPVPLFPRYIFTQINLSLDNWASIRSSYGVSRIITFGESFTPVSPKVIELIQDKLNEDGIYNQYISRANYRKGDSLTIKEGLFAGVNAIFLSDKPKDRVRILLKLLNTTVVSEISKSEIGHKEVVKTFKL